MSFKTTGLSDSEDDESQNKPLLVTEDGERYFRFEVNGEQNNSSLCSLATVASRRSPIPVRRPPRKRARKQTSVLPFDVSQPSITSCFSPVTVGEGNKNTNEILPKVDLAMLLLGSGMENYDRIEVKAGAARNGSHLPVDCFVRVGIFLKMFTIQGAASREIGSKQKHKHLHVAFCLRFPSTPGSIRKLKTFFRDFVLGLATDDVRDMMPEAFRQDSRLYDTQTKKDETSNHRIWLDVIKNSSDSFHLQTGYLMKDMGLPHFMLLSHNLDKRQLVEAHKNYVDLKRNAEPDNDKRMIYFTKFPGQLRDFQAKNFGRTASVDTMLSLVWMVRHEGHVFDDKFMTGGKGGGVFDYDRMQAWLKIRSGHYQPTDIALVAFGDASLGATISKIDESRERFEMMQESNDNEDNIANQLVNGCIPEHTDYRELTAEYFETKTEKRDVATVFALMCGHAHKKVVLTTAERDDGELIIETPVLLSNAPARKKNKCSRCGERDGHNSRNCPLAQTNTANLSISDTEE